MSSQVRLSSSAAVDFHVVNSLGVLLHTSPDRAIARKLARKAAKLFEGVEVHEVTVTTTKVRVYRPPVAKAATPVAAPERYAGERIAA